MHVKYVHIEHAYAYFISINKMTIFINKMTNFIDKVAMFINKMTIFINKMTYMCNMHIFYVHILCAYFIVDILLNILFNKISVDMHIEICIFYVHMDMHMHNYAYPWICIIMHIQYAWVCIFEHPCWKAVVPLFSTPPRWSFG